MELGQDPLRQEPSPLCSPSLEVYTKMHVTRTPSVHLACPRPGMQQGWVGVKRVLVTTQQVAGGEKEGGHAQQSLRAL